jgi:hypothetical protein
LGVEIKIRANSTRVGREGSRIQEHRQRVAFCAFGGSDEHPVVTTQRGSGFAGVAGTSVAAAIAAALYGASASALYLKRVTSEYNVRVSNTGQIDVDLVQQAIQQWTESQTDRDSLHHAMTKNCTNVPGPPEEYGAGLVRCLAHHQLP